MVDGYKMNPNNLTEQVKSITENNFFSALGAITENDPLKQTNQLRNNAANNEASNFQEILQKRKEQESKVGKLKCKVVIKVFELDFLIEIILSNAI
jgi:hypothetical protein